MKWYKVNWIAQHFVLSTAVEAENESQAQTYATERMRRSYNFPAFVLTNPKLVFVRIDEIDIPKGGE